MFDFRRITLFCLEKRFSKHKMAIFQKFRGAMASLPPLATPMVGNLLTVVGRINCGLSLAGYK